MTDKLQSGYAPADPLGIEENTESKLLLDFVKENWNLPSVEVGTVDFGGHPSRTNKALTINCYRIFSNVYDKDVGSHTYYFDVPVALDIYVRDVKARGLRTGGPADVLVDIVNYILGFISTHRLGLRNRGINNIKVDRVEYPGDVVESAGQPVWYHCVTQIRFSYHMFRVPID